MEETTGLWQRQEAKPIIKPCNDWKFVVRDSVFTCPKKQAVLVIICDEDDKIVRRPFPSAQLRSHVFGGLTGQANQPSKHGVRSYLHDRSKRELLEICRRESCLR
jgi:hypothetical protein